MKTETIECPKCGNTNCFNVFDTPLEQIEVVWFMCSFCFKKSGKNEWLKMKAAKHATTD